MTIRKFSLLSLSLLSLFALSACGTLNGVGRDLEAAGRGVQSAVN